MSLSDDSTVAESFRVGLVLTGGTIGSELSSVDSIVRINSTPVDTNSMLTNLVFSAWGGTETLELVVRQPLTFPSENMVPGDWQTISDCVRSLTEHSDLDGILILHGTDTATYTAAALAFSLSDIELPIVITGSNIPPDQSNTDAFVNIHDALIAIRNVGNGVFLSFAGSVDQPSFVHFGTHVRKVRASGQAFFSVNCCPVAKITREGMFWCVNNRLMPTRTSCHELLFNNRFTSRFDSRVITIRLYPGLDFTMFESHIMSQKVRGFVIELYPSTTGPNIQGNESLPEFLRLCAKHDIVVVLTLNESPGNKTNMYESTLTIRETGALFIEGLLTETATVKLMWAIAQFDDLNDIRKLIMTPVVGEH